MAFFARTDTVPVDPSLVAPLLSETYRIQYLQTATVTILVYDALIMLDKEARYFWKTPINMVNSVYFVNRYAGIFGAISLLYQGTFDISTRMCYVTLWAENMINWSTIILMDCKCQVNTSLLLKLINIKDILMIRVLALYSQDAALLLCLKALLALEAAIKFGLIIYVVQLDRVVLGALPQNTTFCGTDIDPPWRLVMIDWIIPMVYGTILMILALYKAAEYWRISAGFKGFTLVKVLIQDQFLYFMLVISCSIFNVIDDKLPMSNSFQEVILASLGNPSWLSLLGSRMLLTLKEAGERGQNQGTSYNISSRTVSEIDFADPGNQQRECGSECVTSAHDGAAAEEV